MKYIFRKLRRWLLYVDCECRTESCCASKQVLKTVSRSSVHSWCVMFQFKKFMENNIWFYINQEYGFGLYSSWMPRAIELKILQQFM